MRDETTGVCAAGDWVDRSLRDNASMEAALRNLATLKEIVAGVVVTRSGKIRTHQTLPFILRMGIEAKEFEGPKGDGR